MDDDFEQTNHMLKWIYLISTILIITIIYISYTNFLFDNTYQYNDKNGYKLDLMTSNLYSNNTAIFYLKNFENLDDRIRGIEIEKSTLNLDNHTCTLINSKLEQEEIRHLSFKNNIYVEFHCDNLKKYDILKGYLTIVESQRIYGRDPDYFNNIIHFEFKVK